MIKKYLLLHIHVRGTSTTNANADMIVGEEFLRKLSHLFAEGSREEKVPMISVLVSVTTRHDLGHILIPVVVKHLVSFIDDGVPAGVSHGS